MPIELTDKDEVKPDFYIIFTSEGAQQVFAVVDKNILFNDFAEAILNDISCRKTIRVWDGKAYMCYVPSQTACIGVIIHTAKVFEKMQNDARYEQQKLMSVKGMRQ